MSRHERLPDSPKERRDFLKVAAAITAGVSAGLAGSLAAQADSQPAVEDDMEDRVGTGAAPTNDVPPALACFAAPAGTGAWLDEANHRQGSSSIRIAPWTGTAKESDADLAFLPVHRLAALIQSKQLSPVDLTELFLKRLEKHDPKLLFVVNLMKGSARREAEVAAAEIDRGKYRGPLHGIPYGIKDLFCAKGAPTTWGAKPFEDRVIDADATIVERLRDAGAILVAKLSSGALARGDRWYRGRTNNPWNPARGSSGSSAGPASAVAAGCVPFAIGTETLGSIVSPSRRCGITALRPTFGRVSRAGCMTLAFSMDKAGPMTRNALDCALVMAAIHGADPADPATLTAPFRFDPSADLSKLRIGHDSRVDKDLLAVLRDIGAKPAEIGPRPGNRRRGAGRRRGRSGVRTILNVESACAFDDFLAAKLDAKMVVKDRVRGWREARKTSAVDYLNAQRERYELMQKMAEFMGDWDLYVSSNGDLSLTNMTGHPSVVLPHTFQEGQPQCTMLVGKLSATT